jgi:hypothetical protein
MIVKAPMPLKGVSRRGISTRAGGTPRNISHDTIVENVLDPFGNSLTNHSVSGWASSP